MTAASAFLAAAIVGAAIVVGVIGVEVWLYLAGRRLARYLRGDHKLSERAARRLLVDIYAAKPIVHTRRPDGGTVCGSIEPGETIAWRYQDATCPVCRPEIAEP